MSIPDCIKEISTGGSFGRVLAELGQEPEQSDLTSEREVNNQRTLRVIELMYFMQEFVGNPSFYPPAGLAKIKGVSDIKKFVEWIATKAELRNRKGEISCIFSPRLQNLPAEWRKCQSMSQKSCRSKDVVRVGRAEKVFAFVSCILHFVYYQLGKKSLGIASDFQKEWDEVVANECFGLQKGMLQDLKRICWDPYRSLEEQCLALQRVIVEQLPLTEESEASSEEWLYSKDLLKNDLQSYFSRSLDFTRSRVFLSKRNVIGCIYYLKPGILEEGQPLICSNPQQRRTLETVAGHMLSGVNEGLSEPCCFPAHCGSMKGQSYLLPLPWHQGGSWRFPTMGDGVGGVRVCSDVIHDVWYGFPWEKGAPCPPLMVNAPESETAYLYCAVIDGNADPFETYQKLSQISFCIKNEQEINGGFARISLLVKKLESSSEEGDLNILLDQEISAQLGRFEGLVRFLENCFLSHVVVQRAKAMAAAKSQWEGENGREEQQGIRRGKQMQTLQKKVEQSVRQRSEEALFAGESAEIVIKAHWYFALARDCWKANDWVRVVVMSFDESNPFSVLSRKMSALNISDSLPVRDKRLFVLTIPPGGLGELWWRNVLLPLSILSKGEELVYEHYCELARRDRVSLDDAVCKVFFPCYDWEALEGRFGVQERVAEFDKAQDQDKGDVSEKKKKRSRSKKKKNQGTGQQKGACPIEKTSMDGEQSASKASTGLPPTPERVVAGAGDSRFWSINKNEIGLMGSKILKQRERMDNGEGTSYD